MAFSGFRVPLKWALAAVLLCAGTARADVRLEISGGDRALRDNIAAHIGPLPDADAIGRAYQRRARATALEAAEALGYYNATIELTRVEEGEDSVLRIAVEPGPRVRIAAVDVTLSGEAEQDPAFRELLDVLPLRVGAPLNHAEYESAKRALQNLALRRGYFDAEYSASRVEVDAVDNSARVTLAFDSGRRYAFGEVSFSPTPFRDELLRRLVPFKSGEPYHADAVADFNRALLDSRYFREVRVRPLPEQAEAGRVPVDVTLREQERNRIGIGVGYSTDVGPRLRLTWAMPWRNAMGHSLSTSLELSELRQQITGQYQIPLSNPIRDFLEFQTGYQNEEFEDTDTERYTVSVQRQQTFDDGWQRSVFLRLDREQFEQADQVGDTTLVLPGLSFTRTRSSGGVDPVWGDRLLFSTEATDPLLGSDVRLGRVRLGARFLRGISERHRFFFRIDTGGVWTREFEEVPPSLRFFAGGDQSVRGFAYNSLSPEADNGELIGGRYLITGSAEYGWQWREKWRLSTFIDAGNAFDNPGEEPLRIGTGFGVAWISPVGPIRLDFAWGVSEDDPPFRVHFTMGPRL
jgi:translocation and assembly module TamA